MLTYKVISLPRVPSISLVPNQTRPYIIEHFHRNIFLQIKETSVKFMKPQGSLKEINNDNVIIWHECIMMLKYDNNSLMLIEKNSKMGVQMFLMHRK